MVAAMEGIESVKEIQEAEKRGKKLLDDALSRKEAKIREAKEKAAQIITDAGAAAKKLKEEALESAEKEAENMRSERLEAARKEADAILGTKTTPGKLDKITNAATKSILGNQG